MLCEMARMSCDDGLVMQLHPGVLRNHHPPTLRDFGTDRGADIPVAVEFTRSLRPLLERYGDHPNFRIVLFTLDETTWSRELAPLAGFYPSVYLGAPWWFLDTPDAMLRFRAAVTDTAGFAKTSGFVDDTRAFCSIPARHDTARRVDCAFLSRLVVEHRLDEEEAAETAARPRPPAASPGLPVLTRLCRESWPAAGPPRPIRAVHLGLGAFHRSHQAWYTEHAADRDAWGIAGFTGRSPGTASLLQAQGGLYTLVERGPARDRPEVVGSISAAHDGDDAGAWAGWIV